MVSFFGYLNIFYKTPRIKLKGFFLRIVIEIKLGNSIDKALWSEFVESHPNGNPFQSPQMYEVYSLTKGMEPSAIAIFDNDQMIGLLVTNTIYQFNSISLIKNLSKRALIIGGPLVTGNNKVRVGNLLIKQHEKLVGKSILFTEFRNLYDNSKNKYFHKNGYRYNPHLNYLVDLTIGKENLWNNLSQSKRRYIRKGLKQSNIKTIDTKDDFIPFYHKLKDFYTEKVRKPLPHISHFESLFDIFKPNNMLKIFTVEKEGSLKGGIICILYKNTIYEYYIFSERGKNIFASEICTWEPINFGSLNGFKTFDFMGAGKPKDNYGVQKFKEGFGGDLVQYGRFQKIHLPLISNIATSVQPIYSKLFSKK